MSAEHLELRVLAPRDMDSLTALIAESEAEGFRFLGRIRREFAADAAYLDSATSAVLGVCDGELLIAIGGLTADPYLADPAVGRVRHVYVASAFRRCGVGRMLVTALERRAGITYTLLRLRTDTTRGAAFYEAIGYQPITTDSATHFRELQA